MDNALRAMGFAAEDAARRLAGWRTPDDVLLLLWRKRGAALSRRFLATGYADISLAKDGGLRL